MKLYQFLLGDDRREYMSDPYYLTLDFETYYSKEYSLSRMSTREYIEDPRFEPLLLAMKVNGGKTMVFEKPQIAEALSVLDWSRVVQISHNNRFDASILAFHYDIHPARLLCTMAMAQATVFPRSGSASLANCAKFVGLPPKGTEVVKALGKTFADFTPHELEAYKGYCALDNDLCWGLFKHIKETYDFPQSELMLIHHNLQCYTEPLLELDADILAVHLNDVIAKKDQLINNALLLSSCSMDDLASNPKFAVVLEGLGVSPPRKRSPATGKITWAFSKSDWAFKELLNHEDPTVQALMAARFGSKSTLEQSRTERLLKLAQTQKGLSVPLKYAGAHTLRFSGDEKLNMQNLTRGSRIRDAIKAPAGHKIIAADASQIEARVLAVLAGQWDLVKQFEDGEDVYANFASRVFGKVIHKSIHPKERFIGKVGVLSLGYGCGKERFFHMLRMSTEDRELSNDMSNRVVDTYRDEYSRIKRLWSRFDKFIERMASGEHFEYGPLKFEGTSVVLPNNTMLQYPGLEKNVNTEEWEYSSGRRVRKLYGAKLVENVTQALARVVTLSVIDKMASNRSRAKFVLSVHDELIFVVPENAVEVHLNYLVNLMKDPPEWMPRLPLDAEGGSGDSYGDVK